MTKFRLSTLVVLLSAAVGAPRLSAQAVATATGNALSVGLAYQNADPDYGPVRSSGIGVFANYDFSRFLGVTAELNLPTAFSSVVFLEHSYVVGARGSYHYHRYQAYAKGLIGGASASDNAPHGAPIYNAPATYPIYAIGGGLDIRFEHHIELRAIDYEQQHWLQYHPHGLTPSILSFGAAYRFQ